VLIVPTVTAAINSTTNPSLIKKAGAKNYKTYPKEILTICPNKPVSL